MKNIKEESITKEEADKIILKIVSLYEKTPSQYIFCLLTQGYFNIMTEWFLEFGNKHEVKMHPASRNFICLCAELQKNIDKVTKKLTEFYGLDYEAFIHEINSNKEIH